MMRTAKTLILFTALLVLVWFAATYAAQRDRPDTSYNSYDVVVGPQKSDMQRMIEAYENLSQQYIVLVQDNLALMANQDRQILEKLTELEKKLDAMAEKVGGQQPTAAAVPQSAKQPAAPVVQY